jgi:hypothetical protein
MPLRYLVDEHLRGTLALVAIRVARREGFEIDLVQVGDVPDLPLGTTDRDLIRWAALNDRIIVSHDCATLPNHLREHLAAGGHSPGIFIARRPLNVVLAEWIVLAAYASDAQEWQDRVTFVP